MALLALCAWDLDGTLVDTLDDICLHVNRTLAALGLPEQPADQIRIHVGRGAVELLRGVLVHEHLVLRALGMFQQSYLDMPVVHSRLFAGGRESLQAMKRAGIYNAVVTNKPKDITERILQVLDVRDLFVAVEGAAPHLPTKPDPTLLRRAAHTAQVTDPRRVTLVGDSFIDLMTAHAFGCGFVGVAHGMDKGAGLRAHGQQVHASLMEAGAFAMQHLQRCCAGLA
jgi:phosphoglycolate phosphatase